MALLVHRGLNSTSLLTHRLVQSPKCQNAAFRHLESGHKDLSEPPVGKRLPFRARNASHVAFLRLETKAEVAQTRSRFTPSKTGIL